MLAHTRLVLLLAATSGFLATTTAQCQMSGVTSWLLPVTLQVSDTQRGEFFRADTSNILGIASAVHSGDALNQGPYFEAALVDSQFVLSLSEQFAEYEEYEYSNLINILVSFTCTGGNNNLVFSIEVQDTNNNDPRFVPSDAYTFNIAPPIVPGYELTNCYGDLVVRDIDLTTQSIIFGIEDNPYFEISYGGVDASDTKNFHAVLRASTLIRSLDEPLVLQISATDVDLTGDPARTMYGTVTIEASDQFALPAEPVFSEAFYTAAYSADHQLTLDQDIVLQQGYDEEVVFTLEGEHSGYFSLTSVGNSITLLLLEQLPAAIIQGDNNVILVVIASREYTSGDTATVIINLPQASSLQFEQISYEGAIVDNTLQLDPLVLSDIDTAVTNAAVFGDYENFFTAQVTGSTVTISMSPLPDSVIEDNSFINLLVEATSSDSGVATAVVILDVVKDDTITPVFTQDFYVGSYDSVAGLQIADVSLIQGFDETVSFSLDGDAAQYFTVVQSGSSASVVVVSPPPDDVIASQHHLLFSVRASKPRTVGASAAVSVALPSARTLRFGEDSYKGSLAGAILDIDQFYLVEGFAEDVIFTLSGEFETNFFVSNENNIVTLSLVDVLSSEDVEANDVIVLTLEARGTNAVATKTTIVLVILKDDTTTPVFSEKVYGGTMSESQVVDLWTAVSLSQGYDGNVTFTLEGDNSEYFSLAAGGNSLSIAVSTQIPLAVLQQNSFFVFSVVATKLGTVGAHATISLALPQEREMRFEQDSYVGALSSDSVELPAISLSQGYREDVAFTLSGDYWEYFVISSDAGGVTIDLWTPLPDDVAESTSFIILTVEASGNFARSARAVVTLELIKEEIEAPVFAAYVFTGLYSEGILTLLDEITLSQGYDTSVEFSIEGDAAQYFLAQPSGNSLDIVTLNQIPTDVILETNRLVFTVIANKPGSRPANAAVTVEIEQAALLRFSETSYIGSLNGETLQLEDIILVEGFTNETQFEINGQHAEYFALSNVVNIVTISLVSSVPQDVINDNTVIVLELVASGVQAISAQTAIVLEIERENDTVVPVFTETYYQGSYTEAEGLTTDVIMSLAQGFDETVTFALTGDQSQWFTIQETGNLVILLVLQPIPSAILANNNHLIFSIVANKPGSLGASSAISITLPDDLSSARVLRFEQASYTGAISDDEVQLDPIILIDGYEDNDVFTLNGEHAAYFTHSNVGNIVTISLVSSVPQDVINDNTVIVLELVASGVQAISAQTAIVLEIERENDTVMLMFSETYYTGSYTEAEGLSTDVVMSLAQGFDETVTFALTGDQSQWFTTQQNENLVTLLVLQPLPSAILANNNNLIFSIVANKPGTIDASSAISITLPDDFSSARVLRFDQGSYTGLIRDDEVELDPIILIDGYEDNDVFTLNGEHAEYFTHTNVGNIVTINLVSTLPEDVINDNTVIVLELVASGVQAISAQTAIVLEIERENDTVVPVFSESYYTGSYTEAEGLTTDSIMSLAQGFDDTVTFALTGDQSQWFTTQQTGNFVTLLVLQPIPSAILANNNHLIFSIVANKPGTVGASSAISITLLDDLSSARVLRFERGSYTGAIRDDEVQLDPIILIDGYEDNDVFTLNGEHAAYFTQSNIGNIVTINLVSTLPQDVINDNTVIVLELVASGVQVISAQTAIVLEVERENDTVVPVFSETYYQGSYTEAEGLTADVIVSLVQGFDDTVTFALTGDQAQWFTTQQTGNFVTLLVLQPIPSDILVNNNHIIFSIVANKPGTVGASSAISISLPDGGDASVYFERGLYSGRLELGLVTHEAILLHGYTGAAVQLTGEYASQFSAALSDDAAAGGAVTATVTVTAAGDGSVPPDVSHVPLQLDAGAARTALVLDVLHSDTEVPPTVAFDSAEYVVRADAAQVGLLGRVTAVADNGETVVYSLEHDSSHLSERLSVSSGGELWLSAPAAPGAYRLTARAAALASQATAEAAVHLTVDTIIVCGTDDRILNPLIIIDRDEELPHDELIILNQELGSVCSYSFNYRWPQDRDWLFINGNGHLSSYAIDREDPAIAYMALSQIQIELILTCADTDVTLTHALDESVRNRTKRDLGPYDYGLNSWILTEGISYNSRRSFVNIIINDINDNAPIFDGKENEPIVVGYPVHDLLDVVSPTSLVTLQASDADVGENAELMYWSATEELAVAPLSGAVHVRDNSARALTDRARYTVFATDRSGAMNGSLTGDIEILVRLLEMHHVAVLTIRNALIEDEAAIIERLSNALHYDVKSLRATVISDEYDAVDAELYLSNESDEQTNTKTMINLTAKQSNVIKESLRQVESSAIGASLRIFIYGLAYSQIDNSYSEPLEATQLISDIGNAVLSDEWLESYEVSNLREHLDSINVLIFAGNSTSLLISTIVLGCLLVLLIVILIGWYLVNRRKEDNYQEFNDSISQSSGRTLDAPPKFEEMVRPRPDIEEIKRTERRLQEMLDRPVTFQDQPNSNAVETTKATVLYDTISEVPQSDNDLVTFDNRLVKPKDDQLPIVIQSIDKLKPAGDTDDEDEFGESLKIRRKSVVTFNEHVEKIIHVDDITGEQEEEPDVNVYRL